MPMDFPDLAALRAAFDHPTLVSYRAGESETDYRERCAVWSEIEWNDRGQAHEIRTGKGWDQWSQDDNIAFLNRLGLNFKPTPTKPGK